MNQTHKQDMQHDKNEELLKYLVPFREIEFGNGKVVQEYIISKEEILDIIHQAQAERTREIINSIPDVLEHYGDEIDAFGYSWAKNITGKDIKSSLEEKYLQ